jgi:two-component system sensor histidine kinase UhpB
MADMQETKKKETGPKPSTAFRDLVVVVASTVFVLILSYFFDAFVVIVKFLQRHPDKIVYVDEVITTLLALSIGLAVFAWRRWLELKRETAERIKKQEELLRLTATQADVERIISKQTRSDMEQMKEDVREILRLLVHKPKRGV